MNTDYLKAKGQKIIQAVKTRRAGIIGLAILLFFLVFTITGFFVLPPYVKKIAVEKLSEQLGRQVRLGGVLINPYALSLTLKGFDVSEADGKSTFVSFDRLYVNMEIMSLFQGGPVIKELKIDGLYVSIARTGPNAYNFSDILEKLQAVKPGEAEKEPSSPMKFSVGNIQLVDGKIEFDDRPVSTRHSVSQINLTIPFISNRSSYVETFVEPSLSATINGTPVNFKGATKVFADSRETSFDIHFRDIDIPYYLGYAPAKLNIKVPSGKFDIDMKLSYRQFKDRKPLIGLTGEATVKDFIAKLSSARDDLIRIPSAGVKDVTFDMESNRIEVASVRSERGWIGVTRSRDGVLNFASIMSGAPKKAPAGRARAVKKADDDGALSVLLKSLAISAYKVKITDSVPADTFSFNVDDISVKATDISTVRDSKGDLDISLMLEKRGSLSLKGKLSLNPISAELAVNVKALPLKPLNSYVSEKVRAMLADGALHVEGNVVASMPEGSDPSAAFRGRIRINRFALLDKANSEDLLKWETLNIGEADIRFSPMLLHIREIALSNFYSRVIVNANRTTNLQELLIPAPAEGQAKTAAADGEAGAGEQSARPQNIRIDKVTLQGGTINFTDNFIKPRFSGNLLEIGGRITGLTSEENKLADVELRGMYERYAPLEITGKINPLRADRYVELKASFKEMDLTALTSYSGHYAGYTIEKGKLSFQLEYLIVKNKLDAKNSIFIDQLTFGEKVESPEATKLPVKLGVALLKDRKGEINLDIPLSGDLDDPQFSIGGIILKVLVNLLVKAATSPFALLGAVFGGGEQLSYAEFDPGMAAITPETQKKLDILVKALADRPGLKLDIVGHADIEKDREGLKRYLIMRKVKAQKLRDLAKQENATPSLDAVKVTPEEYPVYLKKAYGEEKFPKPRNIIGMAKSLPVPEMEKLMLTNMPVTDDDLRLLARDRGLAVKDYLLKSKQVGQERVFLVESQALVVEKKEGAKSSRVDFKLK
jgi:hypothetical protein